MFHLGIADSCQLLAQTIAGIFTLCDTTFDVYVNKISGGILQLGWIASGPLTFLLAVNRLFSVWYPISSDTDTLSWPYKVVLFIAWVAGFLFFASYMTPYSAVLYFPDIFAWSYDDGPWSDAISQCELYGMFVLLTLCGVIYVIIFARMYRFRKNMNQSSRELRILVQAVIISGYTSSCLITWHTYQYFLPDTKMTQFALNLMNIINPAINPVLYLSLNP
uniref:7TM_GPCR_Srx domain-containing protein n=1 Tax=Steinernema glaseri TaxID=37863 RepID=A0A1I8AAV3_9BILA